MATTQNKPAPAEIAAEFTSIAKSLKANKIAALDLVAPKQRKQLRAQIDRYFSNIMEDVVEMSAMVAEGAKALDAEAPATTKASGAKRTPAKGTGAKATGGKATSGKAASTKAAADATKEAPAQPAS